MAWIDGIANEAQKSGVTSSKEQCESVISYLKSLSISNHNVENMVFVCKSILGCSVDQLKAVVDHLGSIGITGTAATKLLEAHPKILTFTPSGQHLVKDNSRATVTVQERNGRKYSGGGLLAGGSNFRDGGPISPKLWFLCNSPFR